MKQNILVACTFLLLTNFVSAQTATPTRIKFDKTLRNVFNWPGGVIDLEQLKGKAIIFDFWNTHCAPCVGMLPRMDSLNNVYKDDLMIIPVSAESYRIVENFLVSLNKRKNTSVFSVTGDSILHEYFPHQIVPHEVWLDKQHNVVAQTGHEAITPFNLRKLISGTFNNKKSSLAGQQKQLNYNNGEPFFVTLTNALSKKQSAPDTIKQGSFLHQSVMTKRLQMYPSTVYYDSALNTIVATNVNLLTLYKTALGENRNELVFQPNRVLWDVKNPEYYHLSRAGEISFKQKIERENFDQDIKDSITGVWLDDHYFCYQGGLPGLKKVDAFQRMKEDLDNYFKRRFRIQVVLEKRIIDCIVIEDIKLVSNVKPEETKILFSDLSQLLTRLYYAFQAGSNPVVNLSSKKGPVYFDPRLAVDFTDLELLNRQLGLNGLKISKRKQIIDMVVFKDR